MRDREIHFPPLTWTLSADLQIRDWIGLMISRDSRGFVNSTNTPKLWALTPPRKPRLE